MKKLKIVLVPFLLGLLSACGALGLQEAQSFNDRAGYAIATHTAVLETTTRVLDFGEITSAEAESIAEIADSARELVDSARAVKAAGDAAGADKTLAAAVAILQQLQTYLRERQA